MATTKKAPAKASASNVLVFKKEWIFDPPPPFLRLDKAARAKVNQLKDQFVKAINEVIRQG